MVRIYLGLILLLSLVTGGCGYGSKYNSMTSGGAPTLMRLAPNTATAGGAAFSLVVTGSGFGTDAVVFFNGFAKPSQYASTTQVTAQIAASDILSSGTMPVYVRSGGKNSNVIDFTIQ